MQRNLQAVSVESVKGKKKEISQSGEVIVPAEQDVQVLRKPTAKQKLQEKSDEETESDEDADVIQIYSVEKFREEVQKTIKASLREKRGGNV